MRLFISKKFQPKWNRSLSTLRGLRTHTSILTLTEFSKSLSTSSQTLSSSPKRAAWSRSGERSSRRNKRSSSKSTWRTTVLESKIKTNPSCSTSLARSSRKRALSTERALGLDLPYASRFALSSVATSTSTRRWVKDLLFSLLSRL